MDVNTKYGDARADVPFPIAHFLSVDFIMYA